MGDFSTRIYSHSVQVKSKLFTEILELHIAVIWNYNYYILQLTDKQK